MKKEVKKYFDFDGVILDTSPLLFEEWKKNPDRHSLPESEKIKYIQNADWKKIINNSREINDAIYCLKHININTSFIATKIHSLPEEAREKVVYLRDKGVRQDIILIPWYLKKTDIIDAKENILIDDGLFNLDDWYNCGGIPIFFNKDGNDTDPWHQRNDKGYQKVLSLHHFIDM